VWAVHFGYDNYGRTNIPALAQTIKESGANVVGLVESDCSRTWIGNRDLVEYIGETLHFYTDFGSSTAQNTWGCALISQYPIVRSDRIILPSPEGELACLIDADIRVNGTVVNVFVTHFGNTEDELDRELQKEALTALLSRRKDYFSPTIFAGYLTTQVMSDHYLRIVGGGGMLDTTNSFDRYCLYILYRDLLNIEFGRIDKGDVSDTEAQVASFVLKPNITVGVPGTASECRPIGNDHVKCGATGNCGICVFSPSRFCYEPALHSGCVSLNGTWIGRNFSKDAKKISKEAAKEFYQVQFEQQKKDTSTLTKQGEGHYMWTLNDFFNTWEQFTQYKSAVLEAGGVYWRIVMQNMRGGLNRSNGRQLWLGLEMVGNFPEKATATVELTVINSNPTLSVTKRLTHTFTPETEALGTNAIVVADLFNGFFTPNVKISVKVTDVKVSQL